MEHNLIIETGHFLPPACSLYLLVSDKYFNNFWIMVSWQICCMRPNMMADARLCDVDPMGCRAFFITHCPLWLPAMSNHSASDGKGNSWEAGLCEDYLDYWLSPPKSPHPLLKGTNPSFAPRFAPLCSPLSSMIPPHPKFLQSLPFQVSPISHKYSWNGAGLREQTSTAPP